MKGKVSFSIDGLEMEAEEGTSILKAAFENNIYIPNLCSHKLLKPRGACRVCMVELEDGRMVTSCETPVAEGMKIFTETEAVKSVREWAVKLLINYHEVDC